jgi:MSHA pilin protein MshC
MPDFSIPRQGFTKDVARRGRPFFASQKAFTMIELIMALVLIGIIAAVTIPRFSGKTAFDARSFFDQSKFMLRYAQKLAIAQNRSVFVRMNGTNVALCFDSACATVVPPPAAQSSASGGCTTVWYCVPVPSGVTLTTAPVTYVAANATFYFSALGQPFNTADTPPTTSFNAPLQVTVTENGDNSTFAVERETGYVH